MNGLRKRYEKYANILPSDALEETPAFTQKITINKMKKMNERG